MKLSVLRHHAAAALAAALVTASITALPAQAASGVVAAPVAVPAATPAIAASTGSGAITMIAGLLLVLALLGAIAWFLKRSGLAATMQQSATARIVGGVNVGNRERVVVVEVADTWIVVGVAPGRVNALATMPKQESDPATTAPAAKNFAAWMQQTLAKRSGNGNGNGNETP